MNSDSVVWTVIGVAYVLGFVAGIAKDLGLLIVALVISLVVGLIAQFSGVAEDVKSKLGGHPWIVVPITGGFGALGCGIRWGYDKYMGRE